MANDGNALTILNSVPTVPIGHATGDNSRINRHDFPEGFIFGNGTSSYQVEGGALIGGKSLSNWDDFTRRTPNRIEDGQNGNTACDMYHRYKEDLRLMKNLGFDSYRFSISWCRILPGGRATGGVNREGIDYYNDLINTILANGLKSCVTLFHWDLPLTLEQEYNGFLSRKIKDDFLEYAEICFFEFGDRVKWWTTINEAWSYAVGGYVRATFPPGIPSTTNERALRNLISYRSAPLPRVPLTTLRQQSAAAARFDKNDPAKDAYTVGRNLLLAHAYTVHLYRTKFQPHQNGEIGFVLCSQWVVPYDEGSEDDKAAALRAVDFILGWFLEPVLYGHYPQSMLEFVPPENLAPFTHYEAALLKGSVDFIGFNYYTASYAQYDPNPEGEGYESDVKVIFRSDRDGVLIGEPTGSSWLFSVPWGIYEHLLHFKNNYPDLPHMYITENGCSQKSDFNKSAKEACVDITRTKYHQDHLANILNAMKDSKIDLRAYFAWSYCDNFEWTEGYLGRFGLVYIDYINDLTRYRKNSAMWFVKFLQWDKDQMPGLLTNKRGTEEEAQNGLLKKLKPAS